VVTSPTNDGYNQELLHSSLKKRSSLLDNIFGLPVGIGNLVGGIVTDTRKVIDRVNPLNIIFSGNTEKNPVKNRADSSGSRTVGRIKNNIPKATGPEQWDPLGNLLGGAEGVLDTVLGTKGQTSSSARTGSSVAPPPGGHGRGVPAIFFNIGNILQNILEVFGGILHWNEHAEPGYIMSKIQSTLQSLEALKDIYLQRDMKGGVGEIPKHVAGILKSIESLSDTLKNNDPGNILTLLGSGQTLLRNVGELKDDFVEPVSTTPVPGGLFGGLLRGLSMILPHNDTKNIKELNQTSLQEMYGAFGNVVWNTGELVDTLKVIDETLEIYHPNNTLLHFIAKAEELAKLCLTNNTFDDENILDVIQKMWFPEMTLAEMIAYFGKTLKELFPNFSIVQIMGGLMQQKVFVDLGLNMLVRGSNILRFGTVKSSLIHPMAELSDILLGRDINGLFAFGIEILEKFAETVEWCLKTYHVILDQLILKLNGEVDLRQTTTEGVMNQKIKSTRRPNDSHEVRNRTRSTS
jgi:hypothetical protein